MKFTEEEAYKELVAKLTNNGKSPLQATERTLKAMLKRDYSLLANDETELTDFITSNLPVYNEYNGEARNVNSDYIKAQGLVKPIVDKPIEKPNDKPKSELETLMAEMAAIKSQLEKAQTEQVIQSKKQSLLSKMKELGVKDDEWANAVLSKVNISEDIDVEAEANDYLSIYNKVVASVKPTTTPKDSHHTDTTNSDFERIRKEREKELEQLKKI